MLSETIVSRPFMTGRCLVGRGPRAGARPGLRPSDQMSVILAPATPRQLANRYLEGVAEPNPLTTLWMGSLGLGDLGL